MIRGSETFVLALLLVWGGGGLLAQRPTSVGVKPGTQTYDPAVVAAGKMRFAANCAFCHGRDATGGESGPNLTHSSVVTADMDGNQIGPVVRNGRPAAGMPKFTVSDAELKELVAFLHTQAAGANSEEAERRRITLQDLLTGNAEAGKQYFGAHCAKCHSATGDLAGIAHKHQPIQLETVMLYPGRRERKATVTTSSGEQIQGKLVHLDEFAVSLLDAQGWQRSWPRQDVRVDVQDPGAEHLKLLPQYTDADVHNVFAYLETLK